MATMILTTPEQIDALRFNMIRRGLALKIDTGMELTRGVSTLGAAKRFGFTNKGTAATALKQMNDTAESIGWERVVPRKRPNL